MLGKVLRGLLFGVTASDPFTFLAVGALILAVAAIAGFFPATRAARIDPARVLAAEPGGASFLRR